MIRNFTNFFMETTANWTRCEIPDREPDYVSFSGSAYWDDGDRVIRWSNHWGKDISTCRWYLDLKEFKTLNSLCGYCYYEEFKSNSEIYSREDIS